MAVFFEDLKVGYVEVSEPIAADRDGMVDYALNHDPYPIHVDPEMARRTPFGDVIASFGYTVSLYMQLMHRLPLVRATEPAFLGAVGWEVTFGGPVRPGDQIRMRQTIIDKRRSSRDGRGLVTSRNELLNQHDEIPVSIDARWLLATRPNQPAR
jgi:acyl dehydratase